MMSNSDPFQSIEALIAEWHNDPKRGPIYGLSPQQAANWIFDRCIDDLAAVLADLRARQQEEATTESLIEQLAADTCRGNRHEEYLSNCPVCLDRYIKITKAMQEETRVAPKLLATAASVCNDSRAFGSVNHLCIHPKGHTGAHTSGSASWHGDSETLRVLHARIQGDANGFQKGWHAALTRLRAGDSIETLSDLVPTFTPPERTPTAEPDTIRDWDVRRSAGSPDKLLFTVRTGDGAPYDVYVTDTEALALCQQLAGIAMPPEPAPAAEPETTQVIANRLRVIARDMGTVITVLSRRHELTNQERQQVARLTEWQIDIFNSATELAASPSDTTAANPHLVDCRKNSWLNDGPCTCGADRTPITACEDCGLAYAEFPLDTVLPDADWLTIHPTGDGGLLCAGCIAKRAAAVKTNIVLYARLVLDVDHDALRALKNATWQELARDTTAASPQADMHLMGAVNDLEMMALDGDERWLSDQRKEGIRLMAQALRDALQRRAPSDATGGPQEQSQVGQPLTSAIVLDMAAKQLDALGDSDRALAVRALAQIPSVTANSDPPKT